MEHRLTIGRLATEYRIELELERGVLLNAITGLDHYTGVFGPENQFRIEELASHGWQITGVEWSEPSEVGGTPRIILSLTRTDHHYDPGDAGTPSRSTE